MARTQDQGPKIETVVFDLGGVLIDWNPRYLYRKLFSDEREMERFLAEVCDGPWNERQDEGRPFADAIAERTALHPHYADKISAFFDRWPEMMKSEIAGTVEILEEIHAAKRHRLFALSNWSAETFPHALKRFGFFDRFETVLLSGTEKLIKPDPRFFALLSSRHGVVPEKSIFIDDVEKNVEGARRVGFHAHRFTSPEALREHLLQLGIL